MLAVRSLIRRKRASVAAKKAAEVEAPAETSALEKSVGQWKAFAKDRLALDYVINTSPKRWPPSTRRDMDPPELSWRSKAGNNVGGAPRVVYVLLGKRFGLDERSVSMFIYRA